MIVCCVLWKLIPVSWPDYVYGPNDDWVALMSTKNFFEQPFSVDLEALKGRMVLLGGDIFCFVPDRYVRLC